MHKLLVQERPVNSLNLFEREGKNYILTLLSSRLEGSKEKWGWHSTGGEVGGEALTCRSII